jgi:hypothetical protein
MYFVGGKDAGRKAWPPNTLGMMAGHVCSLFPTLVPAYFDTQSSQSHSIQYQYLTINYLIRTLSYDRAEPANARRELRVTGEHATSKTNVVEVQSVQNV